MQQHEELNPLEIGHLWAIGYGKQKRVERMHRSAAAKAKEKNDREQERQRELSVD
jgi:hypothetical protein